MSVYESVKNTAAADLLEKIVSSGIEEYGLYRAPVAGRIEEVRSEYDEVSGVVCGLNNADTGRSLLGLLKDEAKAGQILDGIAIAAAAFGTDKKVLQLPEEETALGESLTAACEERGIMVDYGIVNVRKNEGCLLLHLLTAKKIAELFGGGVKESAYVCVNGGELQEVEPAKKLSELAPVEGSKAVFLNHCYMKPEDVLELTAGDLKDPEVRILGEKNCIVQDCLKVLTANRKVSCGRCVFCREGLIQLQYMQKETTEARGKTDFFDLNEEIGEAVGMETLCSVGHQAAEPALSAMSLFKDEFTEHIKKNNCPAGECTSFEHIYIDPKRCTGCGDCMDVCDADCIEGKPKFIHMIDEFECTKCGKCIEACEDEAIIKTGGKLPKLPDRLIKVGKWKKH